MKAFHPPTAPLLGILAISLLTGCAPTLEKRRLHHLHLIDQANMVQMITAKKQLLQWQRRDFATFQPYKKVMRTFERDDQGRQEGIITSYYPSGQLMQWLEICEGRAFGTYREWFESGQLRLEATVAGGTADLTPKAQADWLFEGICLAWDERGRKAAQIDYRGGLREGIEQHFWANGRLRRELPHKEGRLHGLERAFDENGRLSLAITHCQGQRSGAGSAYWPSGRRAWSELRDRDRLVSASYWTPAEELVGVVEKGNGWRICFRGDWIAEKQCYSEGWQKGPVEYFDATGFLTRRAHFEQGVLEGTDTEFFPSHSGALGLGTEKTAPQPKLQVTWRAGLLQGPARTWFGNGQLRTYHERVHNKRQGICIHHYPDGQVKLIERYGNDLLQEGRYFGYREVDARTSVFGGRGMVTLFDDGGTVIEQIAYERGNPL